MAANDDDVGAARRRGRIRDILGEAPAASAAPSGRATPSRGRSYLSVVGSNNVVGNGNTINHHYTEPPRIIKKVIVKTGDGVLDAAQKAEIGRLVDQIAETEAAVKQKPREKRSIWTALNRRFKVNSYHEISAEDYKDAVRYLRIQLGRLRSAKSAPKKDASWRNARIKAIHTRCRQFADGTERRINYMASRFEVTSLTELDDQQLDQVYRYVFGWR